MAMGKQYSLKNGFTIIELVIVVVVIGILAVLVFVGYKGITANAVDKSILSDIDTLDGIETQYGIHNGVAGKAWYSGTGSDTDLNFTPSKGNVVDIVINSSDYCIRIYNVSSSTYKTIISAAQKGSTDDACDALVASTQAVSDSPAEQAITYADIGVTSKLVAGNNADLSSYVTGSVSLTAGNFYLLGVNGSGTATPEPTVTMSGVTWTLLTSSTINSANRLSIYYAAPVTNATGTMSIDYGSTQTGLRWSVVELDHVAISGTNGSSAIIQYAAASASTVITMPAPPSQAKNVTIGFFARQSGAGHTPEASFTQINAGGQSTPNMALTALYKVNSQTAEVTLSTNTVGIAIEIAAAQS